MGAAEISVRAAGTRPVLTSLQATGAKRLHALRSPAPDEPEVLVHDGSVTYGEVLSAAARSPIADAVVWSRDLGVVSRTDDRGRFGMPTSEGGGAVQVSAAAQGYFASAVTWSRGPKAPIVLLPPAGAISGTVLDSKGGALASAEVRVLPHPQFGFPGRREAQITQTTANGTFHLAPLQDARPKLLEIRHRDFAPAVLEGVPGGHHRVALTEGFVVAGSVTSDDGGLVAGATLSFQPLVQGESAIDHQIVASVGGRTTFTATTDATGSFRAEHLPEGRFIVRAEASAFADAKLPLLDLRNNARVDVVLSRGTTLWGTVVSDDDLPVEGASLTLLDATVSLPTEFSRQAVSAVSGADGTFLIAALGPGAQTLRVSAEEFVTRTFHGLLPNPTVPVELRLDAASTLTVLVSDERGTEVPAAHILAVRAHSTSAADQQGGSRTVSTTGPDGIAHLRELRAGQWHLFIEAGGFQSTEEMVTIAETGAQVRVEIALKAGATLTGRVLDHQREPVPLAIVSRLTPEERFASSQGTQDTRSDHDGIYELKGLPEGELTFAAQHPGLLPQVKTIVIEHGGNECDFVLPKGAEIHGRVVTSARAPVTAARIDAARGSGSAPEHTATSNASGEFRLTGLEQGTYALAARKAGLARATGSVAVVESGIGEIELVLGSGTTVEGAISGLTREELGRTIVAANRLDEFGEARATRPTTRADYAIEHLDAGQWLVSASVGTGEKTRRETVTLADASLFRVDFDFRDGFTLSGTVLRSHQAVQGAMIFVRSRTMVEGAASTQTDSAGEFRIEGLKEGPYDLSVVNPAGRTAHSQSLELSSDHAIEITLRESTVHGRAVDDLDGAALEAVEVVATPLDHAATVAAYGLGTDQRTPADGSFAINGLAPGLYRITGKKEGYALALADVRVLEDDTAEVTLALRRETGLTLYLHRGAGPTSGRVQLLALDEQGRPGASGWYSAGEHGRVTVPELPSGSWTIYVAAPGSATQRVLGRVPGEPLTVHLRDAGALQITAPALFGQRCSCEVVVLDTSGLPYAALTLGGLQTSWVLSDGAGIVTPVPEGYWQVRIVSGRDTLWAGQVEVAAGQTRHVLVE
jgi:hypothetical protein